MNNPNGNGENQAHERMSRLEYANKVKAEFKQRTAFADQYRPAIREQLNRGFRDFQPPLYSTLRGQGKAQYQLAAEQAAMMLVLATKRAPTETETTALAEFAIKRLDRWSLWKWAMTGVAGYFTYRGAKTYRFPFVKNLTYSGRFHPATAPQLRLAWHLARFVAYYGVTWVMLDPVFLALDSTRSINALKNDDRLRALRTAKLSGDLAGDHASEEEGYQPSYEQPQTVQSDSSTSYQSSGFSGSSGSASAQDGWSRQSNQTTSQEKDPWSDYSNNDDASPIAGSEQNQTASSYGSAWDRIRNQTRPQANAGAQRDQTSWGGSQSQNTWGTTQGGAGWNSNSNGQKLSEKDEAQRQFDQLVERERNGADADQKPWGGR